MEILYRRRPRSPRHRHRSTRTYLWELWKASFPPLLLELWKASFPPLRLPVDRIDSHPDLGVLDNAQQLADDFIQSGHERGTFLLALCSFGFGALWQ